MDMQKGQLLEFKCIDCKTAVNFSVFNLSQADCTIACSYCEKKYLFNDETLKRQLKKFAALCLQIIDSEEILSHAAVGIDLHEHHVKIPYKLLLTRLNSSLELQMGNQPVTINFRIEPLKDLPKNS